MSKNDWALPRLTIFFSIFQVIDNLLIGQISSHYINFGNKQLYMSKRAYVAGFYGDFFNPVAEINLAI
ncbi:hypothetical protein AT251_00590 [Enterovibrio nigricans]|nr:hypothetical protein AT251_00590 [Enterovibrio nigricans]